MVRAIEPRPCKSTNSLFLCVHIMTAKLLDCSSLCRAAHQQSPYSMCKLAQTLTTTYMDTSGPFCSYGGPMPT